MLWWRQEAPAQGKMFLLPGAPVWLGYVGRLCSSGKPCENPEAQRICAVQRDSQLGRKCCLRAQIRNTGDDGCVCPVPWPGTPVPSVREASGSWGSSSQRPRDVPFPAGEGSPGNTPRTHRESPRAFVLPPETAVYVSRSLSAK